MSAEHPAASLRLDVRENTKLAAQAEVAMHDTYLALVSGELARDSKWSPTVQIRFVPKDDGLVEIEVRRV